MEIVKQVIGLLIPLSLALLIVAAGMASARGDLVYLFSRPKLLAKAMLAINVIPPIAAIVVVTLFPAIPLPAKAAILLMAISPVPPLVPGKAFKIGGHAGYIFGLQTATALLAIFTVPLLGRLVDLYYGRDVLFPLPVVASNIFVGVVIPLAIGLLLGRWLAPEFSRRWAPFVSHAANILVILAFLPIIIKMWPLMIALIGDGTVLAMALVALVALAGGYLLGEHDPGDRATLGLAATMRHPGIALALAGANQADPQVSAAVLLFLLVGLVILTPYQILVGRAQHPAGNKPHHA